ncbi:MAG: thiamine pyrophosphate-dependent dehydrogenase E1 component subunit alpha [Candidatus Aminicenantales bacterium]
MSADLWSLYELMFKSRTFEEAVRQIWKDGKISGEMHLGMGEEAIVAGIISQLIEGDAMALDHRGTPPMLMRGVDPVALLREFMGQPDGLCGGMGGHMHLFAPDKLAASSGIVGAAGPAAAGFALAGQMLRPGTVSVAFFGDGAANAGMLMESMNLAVVWKLPVIFVCKDNGWAITTPADMVSGGNLLARAQAFGMKAIEVDGAEVEAVWSAAQAALHHARAGNGPVFLRARCVHLEGHFLGDALLDVVRRPVYSFRKRTWPMVKGFFRSGGGAPWGERIASLRQILGVAFKIQSQTGDGSDPLVRTRQALATEDAARLAELESAVRREIQQSVAKALQSQGSAI